MSLIFLPLMCLTACNSEDVETLLSIWENTIDNHGCNYDFDAQGRCYGTGSIGEANFKANLVGHGWKHYATWEISQDGKRMSNEYYGNMYGVSPHSFYFGSDGTVTRYYVSDAEAMAKKCVTEKYTFNDEATSLFHSSLMFDDGSYMQIVGWTMGQIASFCVIEPLGVTSAGKTIYGVSIYEKMTDAELKDFQSNYHQ